MSIYKDFANLSKYTKVEENNIGLNFFENLKKSKPIFYKYSAQTLYRAYLMEYIIILWDNDYYILINHVNNSHAEFKTKLRGISEDLLSSSFLNSTGYRKLVELQYFLENNYFERYSLIRYLTQAWSNYLYNKQYHYRYIPLNRIYSDKVKKQYLELSQGLADKTVYSDNLSFTDDPVTIALLNYYYYLDRDNYSNLVNSFEASLKTALDDKLVNNYKKIKATKDKGLIMHYINSVGIQRESFTASYGDTLILNQDIMNFKDTDLQCSAFDYIATGNSNCSIPVIINLALSKAGLYHKLFRAFCTKSLECKPLNINQLNKYKQLGFTVDKINRVHV